MAIEARDFIVSSMEAMAEMQRLHWTLPCGAYHQDEGPNGDEHSECYSDFEHGIPLCLPNARSDSFSTLARRASARCFLMARLWLVLRLAAEGPQAYDLWPGDWSGQGRSLAQRC
jgi:hypothetical protein